MEEENHDGSKDYSSRQGQICHSFAVSLHYAAQYLKTRNLAETGVEVSVEAEKLKSPSRLGNFQIRVDSPVYLTTEQREGLMRSVEHCLVKNTLLTPPQIEVELKVPDLLNGGN
jgi:uncharacterized OsmC-like protein